MKYITCIQHALLENKIARSGQDNNPLLTIGEFMILDNINLKINHQLDFLEEKMQELQRIAEHIRQNSNRISKRKTYLFTAK